MNRMTALTDEQLIQFRKELPPGTGILEEDDDPGDPCQIGVIVEPTAEELVEGERDYCGFDEDPPCYVLVAWSWPETPDEVIERRWEAIDSLQKAVPDEAAA